MVLELAEAALELVQAKEKKFVFLRQILGLDREARLKRIKDPLQDPSVTFGHVDPRLQEGTRHSSTPFASSTLDPNKTKRAPGPKWARKASVMAVV